MQPPGAAATAAHTAAQPGQGVALADGVVVVLAAMDGDAVDDALADSLADALAVAVGVGWQASQQNSWLVALPAHRQLVSGQASSWQSTLLHTLPDDRRRGAAAESWRRSSGHE